MRISRKNKGFTLIEIIVALMIFSIVVVVALAALLKIIDANKKAQTTQDAVIGLSFALESMSRELRTGSTIDCETNTSKAFNQSNLAVTSCSADVGRSIAFRSTKPDSSDPSCRLIYAYRFVPKDSYWSLEKAQQTNCNNPINSSSYAPVVSDNVTITEFNLGVTSDAVPTVYIRLTGYAGAAEKIRTYFTVQTASSPRLP